MSRPSRGGEFSSSEGRTGGWRSDGRAWRARVQSIPSTSYVPVALDTVYTPVPESNQL
jgi:hypothetical protein